MAKGKLAMKLRIKMSIESETEYAVEQYLK